MIRYITTTIMYIIIAIILLLLCRFIHKILIMLGV